jgi:uncharacterized membrane protein YfcA
MARAMMITAIIGALIVGLTLGLLGSGGAILTTPIIVFLLHHPEKQAIAESLVIVGVIATWGAVARWRTKHFHLAAAIPFAIASIPASFAGSWVSTFVPGAAQLIALAVLMLGSAVLMLRPPKLEPPPGTVAPRPRHPLTMLLVGFSVGLLTGFTGVGGGFMFVPALVLAARLPMNVAIGTSLALIALNSASGTIPHLLAATPMNWRIVALFAALGIVGVDVGRRVSARLNHRTLRKLFGVFLLLLAVYILARELGGLHSPQSPQMQS